MVPSRYCDSRSGMGGAAEKKKDDKPLEIVARTRRGRERGGVLTARLVSALLLRDETVYVVLPGGAFCKWDMTEEEGEASADLSSSGEMRTTLRFVREWDIDLYEDITRS